MWLNRKVPPNQLRLEEHCQCRAELIQEVVDDYAEAYRQKAPMPPVSAFEVSDGTWVVVDGFHRVAAALIAGVEWIEARVKKGSLDDAAWAALSANRTHGLRRSNADKRRAVGIALRHPSGRLLSDREIAKHCGVSHTLVIEVRQGLGTPDPVSNDFGQLGSQLEESSSSTPKPLKSHTPASVKPKRRQGADGKWRAVGQQKGNGQRTETQIPSPDPDPQPTPEPQGPIDPRDTVADAIRDVRQLVQRTARDHPELEAECNHAIPKLKDCEARFRLGKDVTCPKCAGEGCLWCGDKGTLTERKIRSMKHSDKILSRGLTAASGRRPL